MSAVADWMRIAETAEQPYNPPVSGFGATDFMADDTRGPAYRILTQRLVIRCWDPGDAPLLLEAVTANLEHLRPWLPWALDEPTSLEEKVVFLRRMRIRFEQGEDFIYGIFDRDEKRVLGGTGLHTRLGPGAREIGYWIHKDFINQGLASEASAALTRVAFEIDRVERVEIHCDPLNVRSAAVPRKLGFTHVVTRIQDHPSTYGEMRDTMIWVLAAADYPGSPAASARLEAYDAAGRRIL
jgi:RimJ/RimL family protein N-acetyltransferase